MAYPSKTRHVNNQCIAGYAGYDSKTRYLPPEHFLSNVFREKLAESCRAGALKGQGPDGKLLVRMREEGREWIPTLASWSILTISSSPKFCFLRLLRVVNQKAHLTMP